MFDTTNANCLQTDPELFFPVGNVSRSQEKLILQICSTCEIWKQCYDYSLKYRVEGYWAGTNETQRKQIRDELGIEPIRLDTSYKELLESQSPDAIKAREKRKQQQAGQE